MAFYKQSSEDPDQTPHNAVSDLGLHCSSTSLKKGRTAERGNVSLLMTSLFLVHYLIN